MELEIGMDWFFFLFIYDYDNYMGNKSDWMIFY